MSRLPLPPRLAGLLRSSPNLSLYFDQGLDTYTEEWGLKAHGHEKSPKQKFFETFKGRFSSDAGAKKQFEQFIACRKDTLLKAVGARCAPAPTGARLVIGLGLAHPTEAGFLFDRLTGCPYLPGSSVKGLLREAARFAAAREFPEAKVLADADFWRENRLRIFGPALGEPGYPAEGEMAFYDAFPNQWPKLELDVMTPHYGPYYEKGETPGDWFNPTPVTFLALAPECCFEFFFRGFDQARKDGDEAAVERLLPVALDWLGIGAKKSAGYGVFGEPASAGQKAQSIPAPQRPATPLTPTPGKRQSDREREPRPRRPIAPPMVTTLEDRRRVALSKEAVTLVSPVKNGKASVRTGDGVEVVCEGVPAFGAVVGREAKAEVERRDGTAVRAHWKRWS